MSLKRYAIADEVPKRCDYIKQGKEYEAVKCGNITERITGERGLPVYINTVSCSHLYGKSWRIVERES